MFQKLVGYIIPAALFAVAYVILSLASCVKFGTLTQDAGMHPTVKSDGFGMYTAVRFEGDGRAVSVSGAINRNDIVIFEYQRRPGDDKVTFAGRVLGLPGDLIRIDRGEIYRNGSRVPEEYVPQGNRSEESLEEFVVPRDTLFIVYDNRKFGTADGKSGFPDSRGLGPIGIWAVVGKIK